MGKMRFSLIAMMLVLVTAVSAQATLGVKGGINMSNFSGSGLSDKKAKIGFHIGLAADYEFMFNSAIQTGLFFTTKGAKYTEYDGGSSAKYSVNPVYLQLPVHYAYKFDVLPMTRLVFHAGPYLAYGVGGKAKLKSSMGGDFSDRDGEKVFGKNKLLKPFDAGIGIGIGAELGQLILDLGWDMGLVDISKTSSRKIKNQNAYLSLGYRF